MLRKLILLIAVLTSTLAACGDAAAVSLADAATRTLDESTARFEVTISIEDAGELSPLASDGPAELRATGAYDLAAERATLEVDVGPLLDAVGSGEEPMEIVVDGDVTYMRFGLLRQLAGADGWVRADRERVGGLLGGGDAGSLAQVSPSDLLGSLVDAADVERVGDDDVRGVETTHHRGTLERDGETSRVDAWVDDSGLVRRLDLEREGVTFRVELFDFGEAVDISVPPPGEVTELSVGGR